MNLDKVKACCVWMFALKRVDKNTIEPIDKLLYNMRVTAKCRYNAAKRPTWHKKISFFTTTFLSLGLIFIPLMKNTNVQLHFETSVLNTMQIFLAVSILVYSVINGLSKYETRIQEHRECADKIRSLESELKSRRNEKNCNLSEFRQRYDEVLIVPENHEDIDYFNTKLAFVHDVKFVHLMASKLNAITSY